MEQVEYGTLEPVNPFKFQNGSTGFFWKATTPNARPGHCSTFTWETRACAEHWLWLRAEIAAGYEMRTGRDYVTDEPLHQDDENIQ